MEKEISSGAMLGIVLIALAAIIGLGFGVFAIAKSTANEGVTNVQENLEAASNSQFTDYDQKTITGTQVLSAINTFNGKSVAVLVMTQANKDLAVDSDADWETANGVDSAYGKAGKDITDYFVAATIKTSDPDSGKIEYTYGDESLGITDSYGENVKEPVFINYNALLGTSDDAPGDAERFIYFDSDKWVTTTTFEAKNGKVQFNNITANLSKSGMMEYVSTGARFQSYLIKDNAGTTMGVAFEQISQ